MKRDFFSFFVHFFVILPPKYRKKMQKVMKKILLVLLLVVSCMPIFAQRGKGSHNAEVALNLERFNEIYRMLDLFYVDSLAPDTVMQWAIEGMLRRIDPFTSYFKEEDDDLRQMTTGKYAGIGSVIRYSMKHERTVIAEPYEGTPSERVGLRAGDILMKIDGKDLKGKLTPEVSNMLRGEAGTKFSLVFQRPGEKKERSVEITRETISLPSVPYHGMIRPGVGYIYLTGFTEGCAKTVHRALMDLKKQGAESLVLDLRDNPGGALEEAVDIVNLFVEKGTRVVYTQGKLAPANREYMTTTDPVDTEIPIVVLVSEGTASSAEIVSGSLQDLDRAVVMGRKTYGKGLVQMVRGLQSGGSVKITTSRYHIPSGRCIQAHDYYHDGTERTVPDSLTKVFYTKGGREVRDGGGIKPDIVMPEDTLPVMFWKVAASESFMDWCTEYRQKHETVAVVRDFGVSDEEYSDFVSHVCAEDSTVSADTLTKYAGRMKDMIDVELVTRYYHNRGSLEKLTQTDGTIQRAVNLLDDRERYKKVLSK